MMGSVGGVLRLGLCDVLESAGVALVSDPAAADAVVIDRDAADSRARAADLLRAFPDVTVIACSAQLESMLVTHGRDVRERPFTPHELGVIVRRAAAARAAA
jgi:hypothetical protein